MPGVGGREPRVIARRLLGEIIEPRMEEIFAMVQRELMRSGVSESLASGIVLVGGTSLLEGTQELAERIFGVPVRRGLPINLKGMPEELMKPMYTTAAGLLLHQSAAARNRQRHWRVRTRWGELRIARNRLGEGFLLRDRRMERNLDEAANSPGAGGGGSEMIELVRNPDPGARIKVIGAGGCGGNAVNHMIDAGLRNVDFIAVNTDMQALQNNQAPLRMQMGTEMTRGRGTGGNPEIGRKAALEDEDRLREILSEAEMVFVTAGMGGGTGTGSAPVIARIARELGALTVGVVTKPFQFEGRKRMSQAEEGLRELKNAVDTLITIPNQRLLSVASRNTSLKEAFQKADDVLLQAVRGISELVTVHGLINLDFADVRSIMAEMGMAMMGAATAAGENRAVEAAQRAISSPLLEDVSIKGARGLLINVTGGPDMSLYEVNEAASLIQEEAHEDANIIFGAVIDEKMTDEIRVTVIATGFGDLDKLPARYSPSGAPRHHADCGGVDAAGRSDGGRSRAALPAQAGQVRMFPGNKPVRRMGMVVDDSTLDIPAFRRRGEDGGTGGRREAGAEFAARRRRQARHPDVPAQASRLIGEGASPVSRRNASRVILSGAAPHLRLPAAPATFASEITEARSLRSE